MSRKKVLNLLLIASSLLGYLKWGSDSHAFLFQAEAEVVHKLVTHPLEALHPFTILPMLGQLLLVITLFQKVPGRWLTFIGIGTIGLLLGLMFVIGLLGLQMPILASTLPFIVIAVLTVRAHLDGKRARAR
jgi:NAD/NADP transhydrogenase beta subunit